MSHNGTNQTETWGCRGPGPKGLGHAGSRDLREAPSWSHWTLLPAVARPPPRNGAALRQRLSLSQASVRLLIIYSSHCWLARSRRAAPGRCVRRCRRRAASRRLAASHGRLGAWSYPGCPPIPHLNGGGSESDGAGTPCTSMIRGHHASHECTIIMRASPARLSERRRSGELRP